MPPRPVHRTATFWTGILVLVCILGAWIVSITRMDGFMYRHPSSRIAAGQAAGFFHLLYEPATGGSGTVEWIHTSSDPRSSLPPYQPASLHLKDGRLNLAVSHWLLILLILIPWSIFLTRRFHRTQHLADTPAP